MTSPLTIALAQFRPRKGDYAENLARLGPLFAAADAAPAGGPRVLQLPETALTGYFLEGGVRDAARTAGTMARDLDETYRAAVPAAVAAGRTLDVVIGFYERWHNTLYNSAMYVTLGAGEPRRCVTCIARSFCRRTACSTRSGSSSRGRDVRAFDTPWGRAAMLVCEDAWHSLTGTIAALDGAQIIFLSAAPPARGIGRARTGFRGPPASRDGSGSSGTSPTSTACSSPTSTSSGARAARRSGAARPSPAPSGEIRARGPLLEEALLPVTIDLADVTRARADMPLLADLATMLPDLRERAGPARTHRAAAASYDARCRRAERSGAVPAAHARSRAPAEDRRRWRSTRRSLNSGSSGSFATRCRAADSRARSSASPVASTRR